MVKGIKIYIVFFKDYLKYPLSNIKAKILNSSVITSKSSVIFYKSLIVLIIDFASIFMKKIGSNSRNTVSWSSIGTQQWLAPWHNRDPKYIK